MSPIISTKSTMASIANNHAIASAASPVVPAPHSALDSHKDSASLVPHAGSLLASLSKADEGSLDSGLPASLDHGISPRYLPPSNQSASKFPVGGLLIFGGLLLFIALTICSIILVLKYCGKREQRKTDAESAVSENAQSQMSGTTTGSDKELDEKLAENDLQIHIVICDSDNDSVEDTKINTPAPEEDRKPMPKASNSRKNKNKRITPVYQADCFGITGENFYADDFLGASPVPLNDLVNDIAFYSDPGMPTSSTLDEVPDVISQPLGCDKEEEKDATDIIEEIPSDIDVDSAQPSPSTDADVHEHDSPKDATKLDLSSESALDTLISVLRDSQAELSIDCSTSQTDVSSAAATPESTPGTTSSISATDALSPESPVTELSTSDSDCATHSIESNGMDGALSQCPDLVPTHSLPLDGTTATTDSLSRKHSTFEARAALLRGLPPPDFPITAVTPRAFTKHGYPEFNPPPNPPPIPSRSAHLDSDLLEAFDFFAVLAALPPKISLPSLAAIPAPPLPSPLPSPACTPPEELPEKPKYLTVPEVSRRTGRMKEPKSIPKKQTRRFRSSTIIPPPAKPTSRRLSKAVQEGGRTRPAARDTSAGSDLGHGGSSSSDALQPEDTKPKPTPSETATTQCGALKAEKATVFRTLEVVDTNIPAPVPGSGNVTAPKETSSKLTVERKGPSRRSQENATVPPSGRADTSLRTSTDKPSASRQRRNGRIFDTSKNTAKVSSLTYAKELQDLVSRRSTKSSWR